MRRWATFSILEIFCECEKNAAPRSVLRRSDADARTVANFIDAISDIDQRKTNIRLADFRKIEIAIGGQVDLVILRQVLGVGEAGAQTRSVQEVAANAHAVPVVGNSAAAGEALIVIEMHPM